MVSGVNRIPLKGWGEPWWGIVRFCWLKRGLCVLILPSLRLFLLPGLAGSHGCVCRARRLAGVDPQVEFHTECKLDV